MAFGLPFAGGFAHAASQSQQGHGDALVRALQLLRLRREMEMDPLRQAYYLSRLNKPTPKGAGIKLTKGKQQEVFYPATGDEVSLPAGASFQTTGAGPYTKSWETFLNTQSLNDESFSKLAPPQRDALWQKYRSSLSPDLQLKDQLIRAHLAQIGLSNDITAKLAPKLLDLIGKEEKAPAGGGSDIVPGVAAMTMGGFDPSDPSSFGDD